MSKTMVALVGSVVRLNLLEPAHAGYWMANAKNVLLSSAVSLSLLVFVHIWGGGDNVEDNGCTNVFVVH